MNGADLRRAAEQARREAETLRGIAPALVRAYGDDAGTERDARRHFAVADWLEREAAWADVGARNSPEPEALAVAATYLDEGTSDAVTPGASPERTGTPTAR